METNSSSVECASVLPGLRDAGSLSFAGTLLIFLAPLALLLFSGCATGHPRWIHRLPEEGQREEGQREEGQREEGQPEEGATLSERAQPVVGSVYRRVVQNRYGVGETCQFSRGSEWIEFHPGDRYRKFHFYAEWVRGEIQLRAYREEGSYHVHTVWILLKPDHASGYRQQFSDPEASAKELKQWKHASSCQESATSSAQSQSTQVEQTDQPARPVRSVRPVEASRRLPEFSDPSGVSFTELGAPEPLLLYAQMNGKASKKLNRLVPLAYDWMGTLYEFGLYELSTGPYEHTSAYFQEGLKKFTEKTFQKHHYSLQE